MVRLPNYTQFDGQCYREAGATHSRTKILLLPPPQSGAVERSKVTSVTSHMEVIDRRVSCPSALASEQHNDRNLFNDGLIMAWGREREHSEDFLTVAPAESFMTDNTSKCFISEDAIQYNANAGRQRERGHESKGNFSPQCDPSGKRSPFHINCSAFILHSFRPTCKIFCTVSTATKHAVKSLLPLFKKNH
jgi:hypothetical protein